MLRDVTTIPSDIVYLRQYGRIFQYTTANDENKYTRFNNPANDIPDTALPVTVEDMYK